MAVTTTPVAYIRNVNYSRLTKTAISDRAVAWQVLCEVLAGVDGEVIASLLRDALEAYAAGDAEQHCTTGDGERDGAKSDGWMGVCVAAAVYCLLYAETNAIAIDPFHLVFSSGLSSTHGAPAARAGYSNLEYHRMRLGVVASLTYKQVLSCLRVSSWDLVFFR